MGKDGRAAGDLIVAVLCKSDIFLALSSINKDRVYTAVREEGFMFQGASNTDFFYPIELRPRVN